MEDELAPYRHLLKAVFDCACRDYIGLVCRYYDGGCLKTESLNIHKIHGEARDWFLADTKDSDWPFTLHNVCSELGWDEATIKRSVRDRENGVVQEWEKKDASN